MQPICEIYKKQIDKETNENEEEQWYDGPVTPTSNNLFSTIQIQNHSLFPILGANVTPMQALAFCNSYRYRYVSYL